MRIEIQLQGEHRLKDKVRRQIAQAITEFLSECKCLPHICLVFRRRLLLRYLQLQFRQIGVARRSADHDFEVTRLDDVLHIHVVKRERLRV